MMNLGTFKSAPPVRPNALTTHTRIAALCSALILAASAMPALAANQGVNFGITVGVRHYCQIVLTQQGTMAVDSGATVLGSKEPGGSAATAEITTTRGSYSVSLDAPTTFDAMPTGGDTGVTFATNYSMTGATTSPEVPGTTSTKAKKGLTSVTMDLTATRSAGVYPAGNYSGVAVLRCE